MRNDWMTLEEAAEWLRISPRTFRRTIRSVVPFHKLGRRIIFRRDDIEQAMNRYCHSGKVVAPWEN